MLKLPSFDGSLVIDTIKGKKSYTASSYHVIILNSKNVAERNVAFSLKMSLHNCLGPYTE
jgi:hypothetical protein